MSDVKWCSRCKSDLPLEAFYKNRSAKDGLTTWCRSCNSLYYRKARIERPEVYLSDDKRKRAIEKAAAWKAANRERVAASGRAYYLRNKLKFQAHEALRKALIRGEIIPQPCQECGRTSDIEAHHPSYEREHWLDVEWLCTSCHGIRHRGPRIPIETA